MSKDQKLTIKELAPYLPYGLKAQNCFREVVEIKGFQSGDERCNNEMWYFIKDGNYLKGYLYECKPLLRPISSIDLKWFQDNIDENLEDFRINCEPEKNHFSVEVCEKVLGWSALSLEEYQLFYEHHVDIHLLHEKGLALPIDEKEVSL